MSHDTGRCPLCGQLNQCAQADPAGAGNDCWCFTTKVSAEALARLSEEQIDVSCLCPTCAKGVAAATANEPNA
jgi:hypothetical protein